MLLLILFFLIKKSSFLRWLADAKSATLGLSISNLDPD